MLNKTKVKELVDHMPETFSVDDIVEQIVVLQKIEAAREEINNGEFYTEKELDAEIDKWD
jgi:predicted transcriptional regulator